MEKADEMEQNGCSWKQAADLTYVRYWDTWKITKGNGAQSQQHHNLEAQQRQLASNLLQLFNCLLPVEISTDPLKWRVQAQQQQHQNKWNEHSYIPKNGVEL